MKEGFGEILLNNQIQCHMSEQDANFKAPQMNINTGDLRTLSIWGVSVEMYLQIWLFYIWVCVCVVVCVHTMDLKDTVSSPRVSTE